MDEFLKTIRFLHQVLIGVCAALIAFSLSPNPRAQYLAALAELDVVLHRLSFQDYVLYAKKMAQLEDEKEAAYLKQRFEKTPVVTKKYVLPVLQDFAVTRPFFCEYPKDNTTVSEHLQFFDSGGPIGEVGFAYGIGYGVAGVSEQLKKILLAQPTALATLQPKLSKMSFKLSEDTPHEAVGSDGATRLLNTPRFGKANVVSFPPDVRDFRGTLWLTFTSHNSSLVDIEPLLSGKEHIEGDQAVTAIEVPPLSSQFVYKTYMAVDWLRAQPDLFQLVHRSQKGQDILFPNLKLLMNQLQSMNLTEASKFLQDKIDSAHNDLSFLGISIQEEVAVWAGPLVVAFVMIYLLSHFRRLHRIIDADSLPVKSFPWIGIFDDGLGRTLTWASIAVAPIASETALLIRSGHWSDRTTLAGILLATATAVVAVFLLIEIRFVCKRLNRSASNE